MEQAGVFRDAARPVAMDARLKATDADFPAGEDETDASHSKADGL